MALAFQVSTVLNSPGNLSMLQRESIACEHRKKKHPPFVSTSQKHRSNCPILPLDKQTRKLRISSQEQSELLLITTLQCDCTPEELDRFWWFEWCIATELIVPKGSHVQIFCRKKMFFSVCLILSTRYPDISAIDSKFDIEPLWQETYFFVSQKKNLWVYVLKSEIRWSFLVLNIISHRKNITLDLVETYSCLMHLNHSWISLGDIFLRKHCCGGFMHVLVCI